jgi:hypothetical protein
MDSGMIQGSAVHEWGKIPDTVPHTAGFGFFSPARAKREYDGAVSLKSLPGRQVRDLSERLGQVAMSAIYALSPGNFVVIAFMKEESDAPH